jgi:hypothetical protein
MLTPKDVHQLALEHAAYLGHQHKMLDILEGNLTSYILDDLKAQLSLQSFMQVAHRISPINILPKIIDKLTHIYQTGVSRRVEGGTETDAELLAWYEKEGSINVSMNDSNEFFNTCQSSLIYPYTYKGKPKLRVIMNDRFIVYSNDTMNPEIPTDVILLAGKDSNGKQLYWVWSADGFYVSDSEEKRRPDIMSEMGNVDGVNPFGVLPFVYVNGSRNRLTPPADVDTYRMVKLVPVMLSDLNLAAMFQAFSIVYGIDVSDENLKFAPNAFWNIKSDATSDKKPEIGTIKPTVDYPQVLSLIESELSIWLGTKGIRAGAVGSLSDENFASGVSKIIDEMDTFEARQKQVEIYTKAEQDLWILITKHMHPYWLQTGQLEGVTAQFSVGAEVVTKFPVQLPAQARGVAVRDAKEEYAAGFITRKHAIMRLNPEMSDEAAEAYMAEIDAERGVVAAAAEEVEDDMEVSDDASETPEDRIEDSEESDKEGED